MLISERDSLLPVMRITDLKIHPIAIADPPLFSSYGLHASYAPRIVIELVSEDGLIGIAEAHGGEAALAAFQAWRPRVVGADAFTLPAHLLPAGDSAEPGADRSQTWRVPGENPCDADWRVYSALEIASLDLLGRALGRPVCDLLGGRVRDAVPFSAYAFYKLAGGGGEAEDARDDQYGEIRTPAAVAASVRRMISEYGFREVKLKAGVFPPREEMEAIRVLRAELGPEIPLRLDPNSVWSLTTAFDVALGLRQELAQGGYLEDPVAGLDGMAELRRRMRAAGLETPLASNVAVTGFQDLPAAIANDAVQIVLCDPHYWGGLRQIQHLGRLCATFHLGLSMHSNTHLGVSLMAMAHAAAVTPQLQFACDTHYPWQSAEDEIVAGGRIRFHAGCVRIPGRPGLGVDLDYDQLARGRERYRRGWGHCRDDAGEMRRRIDPAWRRQIPRW